MTAPDVPLKNLRRLSERVRPPLTPPLDLAINDGAVRISADADFNQDVLRPTLAARMAHGTVVELVMELHLSFNL
jgi:hypothetical protein